MCTDSKLTPKDELPSEIEILECTYNFVQRNFDKFNHKKVNNGYWFIPSWSPFIKYIFYKWGQKLGFTIGLDRGEEFRKFYRMIEGSENEAQMYNDKSLKEYLYIDLSWRSPQSNIPDIPSSQILYLALEHEESTDPRYIVENTYVGAQLDEVRKLGYIRSFLKVLIVRPRYSGNDGKQKRYAEHEETLKKEIEKELKRQYIESHEKWILISIILNDIDNPSVIIFHGYRYDPIDEILKRFDDDKYSIKIDNTSRPCKIKFIN